MGWASEQFWRDVTGHSRSELADLGWSAKSSNNMEEKQEKLPEIDPNIKCMQATIEWKYFDKRIELQTTLDTLIEEGYHVDNVIPKTSYLKTGSTTILLTEAIIIVSK